MKYLIIILSMFTISCNAQTISLEEAAQCMINPNCPNYTYAKDINNSLSKYVGTWKGTYGGNVYELKFNKSLYHDFTGFKRDEITGRLRITTVASNGMVGLINYDNFNEPNDESTSFSGLGFSSDLKSYEMHFSGNSPQGCLNRGSVFIRMNTNNLNQMTVFYWSDMDIVEGECPSSFKQTFPEKQLITLTKQ